jgi:hypothetical protein
MKTSKLTDFLKDFFISCLCLSIIVAILIGSSFIKSFNSSFIWQIVLIGGAYSFFKIAFINKYALEKKAQATNFVIFSTLADFMIILWLFLYSPSKVVNSTFIILCIIVILIVKGAYYAMVYSDNKKHNGHLKKS